MTYVSQKNSDEGNDNGNGSDTNPISSDEARNAGESAARTFNPNLSAGQSKTSTDDESENDGS